MATRAFIAKAFLADARLGCRHGRADARRHRRPRRAGDAALRLPAPRTHTGADRGSSGRPSRAALRRGADGGPRPPRPRLVARGRRPARVAEPNRLGDHPLLGTGLRPSPTQGRMTFPGASVLVTG